MYRGREQSYVALRFRIATYHDVKAIGVVLLGGLLLGRVELAGGAELGPLISGLPSDASWLSACGHLILNGVRQIGCCILHLLDDVLQEEIQRMPLSECTLS